MFGTQGNGMRGRRWTILFFPWSSFVQVSPDTDYDIANFKNVIVMT